MPKSLTVSQLLGRGQLTLGNKVTETLVTFPLESKDRQEGPRAQGCPEGNTWPFQGVWWGGRGKVFAWHWAGPSPVRECGRGAFW